MKKFQKKTDTFNIVATKERIDIRIKNNGSETYSTIIGKAEVWGEENEYVSMNDWTITDIHGELEFIFMDVNIRLILTEEETSEFFSVILGE